MAKALSQTGPSCVFGVKENDHAAPTRLSPHLARPVQGVPERGGHGPRVGARALAAALGEAAGVVPEPLRVLRGHAHEGRARRGRVGATAVRRRGLARNAVLRSEEHTSELQSRENLVCRLLLEKKK